MAVKELRQTHDDIDKAIDQLSEPTNLLLSQNIALNTNIEHPLSATLCHSTSTPRATVTRHCSNLQSALQAKKKALDDLVVRWTQCFKDEEAILDRLDAAGKAQSDAASESSKAQDIDALEREVKSIVTETEEAIDEIETVSHPSRVNCHFWMCADAPFVALLRRHQGRDCPNDFEYDVARKAANVLLLDEWNGCKIPKR